MHDVLSVLHPSFDCYLQAIVDTVEKVVQQYMQQNSQA